MTGFEPRISGVRRFNLFSKVINKALKFLKDVKNYAKVTTICQILSHWIRAATDYRKKYASSFRLN